MIDQRRLEDEVSKLIEQLVEESKPANEQEELTATYHAFRHLAEWGRSNVHRLQPDLSRFRRKV
jgi:hypothetical protein